MQLRIHNINQNTISYIQCTIIVGKVLTYVYVYICKSYVYLLICGGRKRSDILQNHDTDKCGNIMITFIRAIYNQNAYLYMYAYIHHPKVFIYSPYIPTAISVHHSLINTFLPVTPRNDSEILISVNNKQDVPISSVSP